MSESRTREPETVMTLQLALRPSQSLLRCEKRGGSVALSHDKVLGF